MDELNRETGPRENLERQVRRAVNEPTGADDRGCRGSDWAGDERRREKQEERNEVKWASSGG